jgi:DNA processing protein
MPSELESWIALGRISGMGPARFRKIIEFFGNAGNAFSASVTDFACVEGVERKHADAIIAGRSCDGAAVEIDKAEKNGIKIIASFMPEYPAVLKTLYDYPSVIYVRGALSAKDAFSVAVVGTRRNTVYGKAVCEYIAGELAGIGITVVSGLARGIDTFAHRSALDNGGRTVAVLGNGLLHHYPPENRKLEDSIAERGALISEFPLDTMPDKQNFPRRNRIISGLSLGVVVIEAGRESGALITAASALEQGKDVFAVPGSIFSKYSAGPHSLIKQGAKLVESVEDVISEINLLKGLAEKIVKATGPTENGELPGGAAGALYGSIGFEPVHIDVLASKLNLPVERLSLDLLELVMSGKVCELPGKMYMRKR